MWMSGDRRSAIRLMKDNEFPLRWEILLRLSVYTRKVCSGPMELRQLRYFLAVADLENVSRAAERLHISQPPLSRQIRQLEDELGIELFTRTAKSLRLTEAGKVLMVEARSLLEQAERAANATREAAGVSRGPWQVGYAPSLTLKILPELLRLVRRQSGGTRIQLHDLTTAEMLGRVRSHDLDFALVVHPGKAALAGLRFTEVERHAACIVLPSDHRLAEKSTIATKDLAGLSVLALTRDDYPEYRRWLSAIYRPIAASPRLVGEYDSVTSLIAAVAAGEGVTFGIDAYREIAGDRVVVRELAPPAPPIRVGTVHDERRARGALMDLLGALWGTEP